MSLKFIFSFLLFYMMKVNGFGVGSFHFSNGILSLLSLCNNKKKIWKETAKINF